MTLLQAKTSSATTAGGELPLQLNIACGNTNDLSVRHDAGGHAPQRSTDICCDVDCTAPDPETALHPQGATPVSPAAGNFSSRVSIELANQIDHLVERKRVARVRTSPRRKTRRSVSDQDRPRTVVPRRADQPGSRRAIGMSSNAGRKPAPRNQRNSTGSWLKLRSSRQKAFHAQVFKYLTITNSNPFVEIISGTPETPHKFGYSPPGSRSLDHVATRVVRAQSMAIGIRPEGRIREGIIDIDAKPGNRSPYWDKYGENLHLMALRQHAHDIGFRTELLRSSHSNGLHLKVLFPQELHASTVHFVLKLLVEQAGMHKVNAECEIFPSELPWVSKGAPLPRSHGIRLPGGKGSALIRDRQFIDDPAEIYGALLDALNATEVTPAGDALVAEAVKRQRAANAARWESQRNSPYGNKQPAMPEPWTGSGQSNYKIRDLTYVAMTQSAGQPREVIQAKAQKLIQQFPGFEAHASWETKRDVASGAWISEWMDSILRSHGGEFISVKPRNSAHNAEQMERVEASLMEQLQLHGRSVLEWSKRRLMRETGLNFRTVSKWWDRLADLLIKVLHTPPIKALQHLELSSNGCSCSESLDPAVSIPPIASAEAEPSGVPAQTVKTTDQNGFSLKIRSNFARLRGWTSSIVRPDRRAVIPFEMDGDPSSGEGSNPTHAAREIESSKSLPSRVVLTPEERRQVERAELERWIAAG